MTTQVPTICSSCVFFKKNTCPAYPDGIPEGLSVWGDEDHRQLRPDQQGTTVWALKDGKEQQFEDWLFMYVLPAE